ncbi:outer membrane beta-barrel protein [Bergeyella zoohelcum]|uniref:TonB-dependent receptor plug domain-containing protein n=1 Tax=Bergeyella zoohelcum TaxID=1015 RepID=UPI002A91EF8A|nr:outer membrane beta-barrel protein [Bergeyella zoohelcum]MDY6025288.1 outer membrane beta-barrel protein [Bergeyella zoohelcum]
MVFNVEQAVAIQGGNALDALKNTPRVKVENDAVSIIGKGNLMIMVNDKILRLSGADLSEYLKTINIEEIKKIEVITNPPSKYNAEGNSGIINVVTKKSKNNSWNASLRSTFTQAMHTAGNIGGGYNMKKGKLELSSFLRYNNGSNAPIENDHIYYVNSTWETINNRRDYTNNLSARVSLGYQINAKLKTGFNFDFTRARPLIKEDIHTAVSEETNRSGNFAIKTIGRSRMKLLFKSLNYYATYDIDSSGKKMALDIDVFGYENHNNRKFQTVEANNKKLIQARNYGEQDIKNISLNLDMEHPTQWLKMNYGVRFSRVKTNNLFQFFNIEKEIESINIDQSNNFQYQEDIQALYFSGQKSFGEKWEAKIGLRHEWTQTSGFSETLHQLNKN